MLWLIHFRWRVVISMLAAARLAPAVKPSSRFAGSTHCSLSVEQLVMSDD